jgi:hypothetical protein
VPRQAFSDLFKNNQRLIQFGYVRKCMPILALLLILVAAVIHTAWNLLVKQAGERQIFMWWGLVCGAVAFSPAAVLQPLPANAWPYVIGSAVAEAACSGRVVAAP